MSKQGHYIFMTREDAEEMAKIFKGQVVPNIKDHRFHVWFEYEDKDRIDFIERLMYANTDLRKKLNESQEHVSVLTKKNNELIDRLNREYDKTGM